MSSTAHTAPSGETMSAQPVTLVRFFPCTPDLFVQHVAEARRSTDLHAANLSAHTAGHLTREGARCFLAMDGTAGFAVLADGELVNVFSTVRGQGDAIVATAVRNGATHLDCFVGHLSSLYARHGFTVTRTEPNYYGTGPEVAYMTRAVSAPIGDHDANVASWALVEPAPSPTNPDGYATILACGECPAASGAYLVVGVGTARCDRCGHEITPTDVQLDAGESLVIRDGYLAVADHAA